MKIEEQWLMWEPLSQLRGDYYFELIALDAHDANFKIILEKYNNKKEKVHLTFKFGVACYRVMDELYAFEMQKNFLREGSSFYKVINSKYIQWLSDISKGVSYAIQPNMQHFVIFTEDFTLEILNTADPEIEMINAP